MTEVQLLVPQNAIIAENLPAKRRKAGLAYAEGERLADEALRGQWICEGLFLEGEFAETQDAERLIELAKGRRCPVRLCSTKAMEKLSDLESPPPAGVLVRVPEGTMLRRDNWPKQLLILDRLSDPGNAGTLIRCAAAFGFSTVLTAGSVRLNNEKMLRASAGMAFHKNAVFEGGDPKVLAEMLTERGYRVFVLDAHADASLDQMQVDRGQPAALVLGQEAAGVDDSLWSGYQNLKIPLARGVESLNVALSGAIALYEFSRQSRV